VSIAADPFWIVEEMIDDGLDELGRDIEALFVADAALEHGSRFVLRRERPLVVLHQPRKSA